MLTAITKRSEVRAARKRFYAPFQRVEPTKRTLGHQGEAHPHLLYWHLDPGLWAVLEPSEDENRSWNCFGTSDPTRSSGNIAISCEINVPHEGMNRKIGGVFARDTAGTEFIAHTGKIGGSRPGICKTNFVQSFRGKDPREEIYWRAEDSTMPCIVIGALSDPALVEKVYAFVRTVERFKASEFPDDAETASHFTPEFGGERSPYTVTGEINARCDHGLIVNALEAQLTALTPELPHSNISVTNNRYSDLILVDGRRQLAHFEVKTTTSLTDIYSAIGQLMYHTADLRTSPARIAVLPEDLPADALARLKRLGLHVCTYRWERRQPVFPNLRRLLRRLFPS
jgi:hypothetical protein